jgi:hypothetical protein
MELAFLQPRPAAPGAHGKVFLDPEKRGGVLQVSGLPAVPDGKEYQLWVVKGTRLVSAGTFSVSMGGPHFFRIDTIPPLGPRGQATFAITLERRGGELKPAGLIYLAGSGWF